MSTKRRKFETFAAVGIGAMVFALHLHAQRSEKPFHKPVRVLDTVTTDSGAIKGVPPNAAGVRMFKGVPYAAPPIGEKRWRSPERTAPWDGVRPATDFAADCVQPTPADRHVSSEDCLYLNIWTAAQTIAERRPVLVWIHGGGFTAGSGRDVRINGENLAARGIVVVTFNYRVGALGFLAHPELTQESPAHTSGNYGLLDQLAALSWVQRNIMRFGGDPQNVTLGGNSAGALCVNLLVGSPLAKNQFRRVIAESGAAVSSFTVSYPLPLKTTETSGVQFMTAAGADSLAALRRVPAADLLKFRGANRMSIDGYVIPQDPYEIFSTGKQHDVPILNGWNRDDFASPGSIQTLTAYRESVTNRYGSEAQTILNAFPAATDEQARKSADALSRDVLFAWQGYLWVRLQERTGKAPAYTYYFTRVPPDTPQQMARGVFHGSESPYALDNLDKFKRPYAEIDRKLSAVMSSFWINYMHSGDPNGSGLPEWPKFSSKNDQIMEFGETIAVRQTPFKEEMLALDGVSDRLRKSEPSQAK